MEHVTVPKQASWMVRKIMEAKNNLGILSIHIHPRKSVIGQIYLHLLGEQSRIPWKCMLFGNAGRPKAHFTLWLQIQNKLFTSDRLIRWGMDIESKCSLCQQAEESRDHLYVKCEYMKAVMNKLMQWTHIQNITVGDWEHHVQEVTRRAKGKSQAAQLFQMLYTEAVHCIWIKRNKRIFEKESVGWERVAKEIACVCCVQAPLRTVKLVHSYRF